MKITKPRRIELQKPTTVTVAAGVAAEVVVSTAGKFVFILERRATLRLVEMVNRQHSSQDIMIRLAGVGARAEVTAGFHGKRSARHELSITMHHQARQTTGDIMIKGVYADQAIGTFRGLIRIDHAAQQSNSYFADNILLLDAGKATSVPTLEIEANDVKASHGSTTSSVDQDQLFYLESRGIAQREARDMITTGFLQPIFDRMQTV